MQDQIRNPTTVNPRYILQTTIKPRFNGPNKAIMTDMKHIDPFGKNGKFSTNGDDIIIDSGQVSFFSYIPLMSLELLGFLMLIILIVCALFCTCCPICTKEGTTYFGRRHSFR